VLFASRFHPGIAWLTLALAAACAAPGPNQTPATATPNAVQTGQALLTASFASLTPTVTATQTLRVLETLRVSTETPGQTLGVSETPRVSTSMPTPTPSPPPPFSQTGTLTATIAFTPTATLTPTVPLRIGPGNAMSLTQAAVLGPVVISGTRVAKLDQAAWAPDGQLAAAGAAGVLFADPSGLTVTRGYTMGVWTPTLSFSPDGLALALGSVGGTVRLFNRADGALLFQLVQPNLRVSQVRYRPGPPGVLAQLLASLGGDNTIYMWDVAYKKFLGTLSPGPSSAEALEFSGDGQWLAAASGNNVLAWDVNALPAAGWTEPLSPTATLIQDGQVTGLALSRDGFWLAAGNATGTIELWTLPDGQRIGRIAGPSAAAERLAFSPDGRLVAAANADRIIRVWALSSPGAPLAELSGHTNFITSLAFSPDGTALASSGWDGTLRVWEVRSGK
jgi:hypothetical protein